MVVFLYGLVWAELGRYGAVRQLFGTISCQISFLEESPYNMYSIDKRGRKWEQVIEG